jgi:hypothetical protein
LTLIATLANRLTEPVPVALESTRDVPLLANVASIAALAANEVGRISEDVMSNAMLAVNKILHSNDADESVTLAAHFWRGNLLLLQNSLPSACLSFEACIQKSERHVTPYGTRPSLGGGGLDMLAFRRFMIARQSTPRGDTDVDFHPRHCTQANFRLLVAFYSELLLRFGPDTRVFWCATICLLSAVCRLLCAVCYLLSNF